MLHQSLYEGVLFPEDLFEAAIRDPHCRIFMIPSMFPFQPLLPVAVDGNFLVPAFACTCRLPKAVIPSLLVYNSA